MNGLPQREQLYVSIQSMAISASGFQMCIGGGVLMKCKFPLSVLLGLPTIAQWSGALIEDSVMSGFCFSCEPAYLNSRLHI